MVYLQYVWYIARARVFAICYNQAVKPALLCLLMAAMALIASLAMATTPVRVHLQDGSSVVGVITEETEASITVASESETTVVIPRRVIRRIEPLTATGLPRSTPSQSRLFFAPTADPVGNGNVYFAVYEIVIPFVAVGVTDYVSIAGGVSLVPGVDNQIGYGSVKATFINTEPVRVAAAVMWATADGENGGLLYGASTFGSGPVKATLGIGYGFTDGGIAEEPAALLGATFILARSAALITENYVANDGGLGLHGIRFFGETLSADFAIGVGNSGGWLPWVGFSKHFGH